MPLMTGSCLSLEEAQLTATDLAAFERAIGVPATEWGNRCHEISLAILRTRLLGAGRVARGTAKHVTSQHSWIVLDYDCFSRNAVIADPTWWFYKGEEPSIWVGYNLQYHKPHGASSIWEYGRPQEPDGPVIELAGYDSLSDAAKRFLKLIGPLDSRGWMQLANSPLLGWPAAEIIAAMHDTPALSAYPPIDAVGMLTDRNPRNLYW